MGWESFCVVGFDLGPLLQGQTRILHVQYFFKYVLTYFLHLNSYLVTFLHNTICRAQLLCPFLLSLLVFIYSAVLVDSLVSIRPTSILIYYLPPGFSPGGRL